MSYHNLKKSAVLGMVVHSLILEAEAGDRPVWVITGTVSKEYTKKKKNPGCIKYI